MKFLHLSDLHLGKFVHEFSMIEEQEYILKVILGIADKEKPQAVLISGDVYDRTVAPTEALRVFDDFLNGLVRRKIEVFIISGNHDSADRLAFGSRMMNRSGVYISPVYDGKVEPIIRTDEYGEVAFFLLPFLKPVQIRKMFPDIEVLTWSDAVKTAIDHMEIDDSKRNVLLCHQFVTGAATCESEELSVGGADNVDAEVFAPFDYVALGHLHGAQYVGRNTLRYCGTPLKYSFSEVNHKKSVTMIELGEKGDIAINEIPLVPKRDMREIRGRYLEVTSRDFYKDLNTDDYYRITLTDEEDQPDAVGKLRVIYPHLMRLDYDNKRTRAENSVTGIVDASQYTPIQLFDMLYEEQNGQKISDIQKDFLSDLIERVWEGIKVKILCMSQNLKDIRRKLDGASLQVASHIIKLCMYPNSAESNHWKQEVWAILFSVPKRPGINKFPTKQFILDSTLGIWGDILDNIVDAHKGYEANQSDMPDTEIINAVKLYFQWLAAELSENGKVRPQPVYDKLKELGISD